MNYRFLYLCLLLFPVLVHAQYERVAQLPNYIRKVGGVEDTLFTLGGKGIYRSTDLGNSWQVQASLPPPATWYDQFFMHDSIMYITVIGEGIYRSTDNGRTFERKADIAGFGNGQIDYDFIQQNDSTLYFRSAAMGLISLDNGESLVRIPSELGALAALGYIGNESYALAVDRRDLILHRSTDHFATYSSTPLAQFDNQNVVPVCSAVFDNHFVFGTAEGRLFKSADLGASWQEINLGDETGELARIHDLQVTEDTLYAATERGLFLTANLDGQSWRNGSFPDLGYRYNAIPLHTIDRQAGQLFTSFDDSELFKRDSFGVWTTASYGLENTTVSDMYQTGDDLWLLNGRNTQFLSEDGGRSFELFRSPALRPLNSVWSNVDHIVRSDSITLINDAYLYRYDADINHSEEVLQRADRFAVYNDTTWAISFYELMRSPDYGLTWDTITTFEEYASGRRYFPLDIHKLGPIMHVFLARNNSVPGRIMRSVDNGLTFSEVPNMGYNRQYAAEGSIIVVHTNQPWGIGVSQDAGANWEYQNLPFPEETLLKNVAIHDGLLVATTTTHIYYSGDMGVSWSTYPPITTNEQEFYRKVLYHQGEWLCATSQALYRLNEGFMRCQAGINASAPCGFLRGTVFYDQNENCNQDSLEQVLSPYLVKITPGDIYVATDELGQYSLSLPEDTYTLSTVPRADTHLEALCLENNEAIVELMGGARLSTDFALRFPENIQDIAVDLTAYGVSRLAENTYFRLTVENRGSEVVAPLLTFEHPASLALLRSSIPPTTQTTASLHWQLPPMGALSTQQIDLQFRIANDLDLLGQSFVPSLRAEPLEEDETPANNVAALTLTYRAAYDPNDKLVLPAGQGEEGGVTVNDTAFVYTIRFQNTGNDYARNVVLVDTLADEFDLGSFKMISASHRYTYRLLSPNILEWSFRQINLPDSTTNEAASHGYVKFAIELKEALPIGSTIRNRAAIYFDSNPPIFTNQTLNTVTNIQALARVLNIPQLEVFPNPSRAGFNWSWPADLPTKQSAQLLLLDQQGRIISQRTVPALPQQYYQWPPYVPAGLYLLQLLDHQGRPSGYSQLLRQ